MAHTTKRTREEFVAVLTRELGNVPPLQVSEIARKLMRYSATHERLAVDYCNGLIDSDDWDERISPVRKRITTILEGTALKPIFSSDPRGYTVKLLLPSGQYNTWGGAKNGWGIPTS